MSAVASIPDLLRLAVVPVLGWAAWRDVQIRRVPNRLWLPLAGVGALVLVWDALAAGVASPAGSGLGRLYLLRVVASIGVVVPFAYLSWRLRAFGGADAKALMVVAVVFPAPPLYVLPVGDGLLLPAAPTITVFSLTVLVNTVLVAATYPLALTLRNLLAGEVDRRMFVGARVPSASVTERHGSLLETPDGPTRRGLDVDALRMYLRWRGTTLAALRADPERFRDPASLPDERFDPTDGAIATDGGAPVDAGGAVAGRDTAGSEEPPQSADDAPAAPSRDDPWGADAFLADVGEAWGTTPDDLRGGLEVLTRRDRVWYSPGIPFIVPMFVGLVVALTYGDLLFAALNALGLA